MRNDVVLKLICSDKINPLLRDHITPHIRNANPCGIILDDGIKYERVVNGTIYFLPTSEYITIPKPPRRRYIYPNISEILKLCTIGNLNFKSIYQSSPDISGSNSEVAYTTNFDNTSLQAQNILKLGYELAPGPYIFINQERVIDLSNKLFSHYKKDKKNILLKTLDLIYVHEFSHLFIDPKLELDDIRIHEGIANYLTRKVTQKIIDPELFAYFNYVNENQIYRYNMMLWHFEKSVEIIKAMLTNNYNETIRLFYEMITVNPYQEVDGLNANIIGDSPVFIGFGSKNVNIFCSGFINGLANIESGLIVASKIGFIDGILSDNIKVICNDIDNPGFSINQSKIIKKDKTDCDFSKLITKELNTKETGKLIRDQQDVKPELFIKIQYRKKYVSILHSCGLINITPYDVVSEIPRDSICVCCKMPLLENSKQIFYMGDANDNDFHFLDPDPQKDRYLMENSSYTLTYYDNSIGSHNIINIIELWKRINCDILS